MKEIRNILLFGSILLFGAMQINCAGAPKGKQEYKEKEIKELLQSDHYTIQVDRALPMTGRAVNLTSPYSLEMRGDTVMSHLPYFGRAYSIPYGGGDGLHFTERITQKEIQFEEEGTAKITFEVRTDEGKYSYSVNVFRNGSATIFVQPVNRQSITFQGKIGD